MKIFFVLAGDEKIASSRYRVYQYLPYLRDEGFKIHVYPMQTFRSIHDRIATGLNILRIALRHDVIFLQKQSVPVYIVKLVQYVGKRVIFDFDDAIYTPHPKASTKRKKDWGTFLQSVDRILVGNEYLYRYAAQFNDDVVVIPTVIDTSTISLISRTAEHVSPTVTIGWIGNGINLFYLEALRPVFAELGKRYGTTVSVKVVSDREYTCDDIKVINKRWALSEEIEDVCSFDIGVMPLVDDEWSRGKCGFKALLYMACGVPAVASPVGVNREIIEDGYNGFLAGNAEEWNDKLSVLIEDASLRQRLAAHGRDTVERKYSVTVMLPKFVKALTVWD